MITEINLTQTNTDRRNPIRVRPWLYQGNLCANVSELPLFEVDE